MKRAGFKCTACGLLLAISSLASATTYYVSSSGGADTNDGLSAAAPFASITKGLDTAVAGDTVLLKRGDTFVGTAEYVWAKGVEDSGLTIADYGSGNKPVWTIPSTITWYRTIFNCPNELSITNVKFSATGDRNHCALRLYGAHNMTLTSCEFYNLSYGIRPACGANVLAKNCRFELIYWGAFLCYEDSHDSTLTLDGCEVTGWLAGSVIDNEGGFVYVTNTIVHDITDDSTTHENSQEAFVQPIFMAGRYYGNTCSVQNCVFYNIPVSLGRTIIQTKYPTVSNVTTTCIHNTFYNNSLIAVNDLYYKGNSGITCKNNIFAGPGVTGDYGIVEANNGSYANVIEDYNLYYALTGNFQIASVEQTLGTHSITGQDPLFKSTDPASADFLKLSNNSPAYSTAGGWYMGAYPYEEPIVNTPGDANHDGKVDVSDLGILAANYGMTSGATWEKGDFNGDGKVDVSDLGILAANYGTGSSSGADFNADYAKVFGEASAENEEAADDSASDSVCSAVGLPLIAGLLLATGFLTGYRLKE